MRGISIERKAILITILLILMTIVLSILVSYFLSEILPKIFIESTKLLEILKRLVVV